MYAKMESRKIIQSGPSSLSITLPNGWLKDNKLSKGDSIFLDMQKGSIRISPQHNIKKTKEEKEYVISTDKLYLIKEYLNYCFLNNLHKIRLEITKKENKEDTLKLIESYPGYTYSIFQNHIIITSLLDLKDINPDAEFQSIMKSVFCRNDDKIKQDLIFQLEGLKRKVYIANSAVNRLLNSPLEVNEFSIDLDTLIHLKIVLGELPFLINSEIELIKEIGYINNLNKYKDLLRDLKKLMSPLPNSIEEKSSLKHLKEKLNTQLRNTSKINEIKFLNELIKIVSSFLKFCRI